jgi:hypothetical protein
MRTEMRMSSNHAIAAGKPHRPASVTLVALGVLTIASLRLIRLVLAVLDWDFIGTLPGISPVYLVLSGLLWAVVGLPAWWGLWNGRSWAPGLTRWSALAYALYDWVERGYLVWRNLYSSGAAPASTLASDVPANWLFGVIMTVILLAFIFWTLSRPKVRVFFGESNE